MASIELSDVRKRFGKIEVIHGIDMNIDDGELVVIVGPSGCGKSTLLRMVAGLEEVTAGEISIDGRVVNRVEPKDRDIAMVFQTYALYPHMSVFDNMAYGLKIAKVPTSEIRQRVEEAAGLLALTDYLKRKPKALSGGQRQRVAMGRAIVRQPSVFLFDEPLSNLDALLRVQMRLEIKQLQRRLGITSLYVTHDQVEAMTLADRLIVMNAGRAEQVDTPMAVYEHPGSRFVAGFIGSPGMNFLSGKVTGDGRGVELDDGHVIRLQAQALSRTLPHQTVSVGIRPEHIMPGDEAGAAFTLEVITVETLGADTIVYGTRPTPEGRGPQDLVSGARESLAVRLAGAARVAEQSLLHLHVADEHWHLFDRDSGIRI